jgi:excisionase family DNA binding protein
MSTVARETKLSELDADRLHLWNAKDVAAFLKVSRSWVYHHAEAGLLPSLRVGALLRFDPKAVHLFAYGEGQRPAPTNTKGGA